MSKSDIPVSVFRELVEQINDAVIIFDDQGAAVYENKAFKQLGVEFRQSLLIDAEQNATDSPDVHLRSRHLIKKLSLAQGFALLVSTTESAQATAENTLKALMASLNDTHDIYAAAAQAVQSSLGWRWVAITRFTEARRLEILSFIDRKASLEKFEYDVAGTPCEWVVDSHKFTVFSDLLDSFPEYQALHDMGAKTYAGLIYRGENNEPLGHVMALHDSANVDFSLAEDVINIATIALSSQFQLHDTVSQLHNAEQRLRADPLTGIGNRLAFDDTLKSISLSYDASPNQDWTLAIIDLDRLKPLNDMHGHAAGDQFIKLMASELANMGRQSDMAFRLGGDEFAIVFANSGNTFVNTINRRFEQALQRIRANLQFDISASIGYASLRSVKGNTKNWARLADERMYLQKSENKRQLGNKVTAINTGNRL